MIRMLTFLIGFLLSCTGSAQDAMLSQSFAAPLNLNPALAGAYEGNFRVGMLYRDQWSSLIQDPYRTYTVSGDVKLKFSDDYRNKDYFAAGIIFLADKVNPFDYSTNQISLSAAFHKEIDRENTTFIGAGLIAGITQKNFIYEDFTFQDQFNGVDGYTFGSDEELPKNNHAFLDIGLGFNASRRFSRDFSANLGVAAFHVNEPNVSFYQEEPEDPTEFVEREQLLDRLINVHFTLNWQYASDFHLSPGLFYSSQGDHRRFKIGSGTRILLNDVVQNAVHFGGWLRMVHELDQLSPNAVVLMAGFEYRRMLVGFSYDLSLADLTTYNQGQHVFEFSLSFIGEYEDEGLFCPRF